MKMRLLLASVLVIAVTWWSIPDSNAQQKTHAPSDAKLRKLFTEKRDALNQRLDSIKALYDSGQVTHEAVLQAHEMVLQTELELATTKEKRLEILEQRISNFRSIEKQAKEAFQNGHGTPDEGLLATATRIQAEIDYVREESHPN